MDDLHCGYRDATLESKMAGIERKSLAEVKGIAVALANVLVIALAMGVAAHDAAVTLLVTVYGGIPAMVLGAVLGWLAGVSATRSPRWRVVLIALPAFGLVAVLAAIFWFTAAVPVACIPTLVAALVLERWTRPISIP